MDLAPARFETVSSQERLTVMQVDFEAAPLPFADDTIDVAIFNEVLEHMRLNPIFTFREINRVLKQHGTLLLSTPNLISLKGWWHLAVKGFPANDLYGAFSKLETVGHAGHVRLYTPLEVAAFLEKMGFAIYLIVHRGDGWRHESRPIEALRNALPKVFPRLRTHFSIVAKKVGEPA